MVTSYEMTQWRTQRQVREQSSGRDGRRGNREKNGYDGRVMDKNAANREHDAMRVISR
ncbi:uncharacterized protein DS421_19g652560 [Arachis hypogaea]|uniref:Uncharacterized protein n=1 Tax=Arachis hypogaea TaxID=3818 RepID=A0A6B9V9Q0_ARAHY|nr:uncharacterized protein DS421_19g652560 [Arachis hypogaea]